jgi:hypothetical protein
LPPTASTIFRSGYLNRLYAGQVDGNHATEADVRDRRGAPQGALRRATSDRPGGTLEGRTHHPARHEQRLLKRQTAAESVRGSR